MPDPCRAVWRIAWHDQSGTHTAETGTPVIFLRDLGPVGWWYVFGMYCVPAGADPKQTATDTRQRPAAGVR